MSRTHATMNSQTAAPISGLLPASVRLVNNAQSILVLVVISLLIIGTGSG